MRYFLLTALLLSATPALAQSVTVSDAWARATPGGAQAGAAYLKVTAMGADDRLVSATTPAAVSAELHESLNDHGVMKMRPLAGLDLPAGHAVTLAPGATHLMLVGLKHPLRAGDSFPLTLNFAHAGPQTVTVSIAKIGASGMNMDPAMTMKPGMKMDMKP